MKRLFVAAMALALAACTTTSADIPADAQRAAAILAVAQNAAAVADAIGEAPPATLTRITIDERGIRLSFRAFDNALTVIDGFVASGALVRNSPTALTIRRGVLMTQAALNAASAAQRAGSATTYTAALRDAECALATVRDALAR